MKKLAYILVLITVPSLGADWVCRDQAAVVSGNTVLACGIGEAKSEADARVLAFNAAKAEFEAICEASGDCRPHGAVMRPKRTECVEIEPGITRCYRALEYAIQKDQTPSQDESSEPEIQPTGWKLGGGVTVGNTENRQLQVGYGLNLKYCLLDTWCPYIGASTGRIRYAFEYGSFANIHAGMQVYFTNRWYANANLGVEYRWDGIPKTDALVTFTTLIGVDAVRVKNVTVSVEGGIKGMRQLGQPQFGLNFSCGF